jgi:hypothetical protein
MPRYRSAGSLDDPSASDGDTGFVGINQREQPNQLQPGEVVLSKNGRIDGFWQPRKGIELKSGQLATSELPLKVPAWIVDSQVAITSAARASNVVTLTISGGHGLDYGANATATLDPAGANNTIDLTAVETGEIGDTVDPLSVAIAETADSEDCIVTSSGRDLTVRAGDKHIMVVTGTSAGALDGTYYLAVKGDASTDWEWTDDGLPISDPGSRKSISGRGNPIGDTWFMTDGGANENDCTYVFIGGENSPSFVYPDSNRWNWIDGGTSVTGQLPESQQVIDAINNDSTASALVTAASSGAATGTTAEVSQTQLTGGWGDTAWFTLGDPANATNPLTGTDNVGAGAYLMTAASDTTLTFADTGTDESLTVDGTYGYVAATLDDGAVGSIYGSCSFSDPANNLAESVYLATGQNAKKVLLSTYAVSDVPYPAGVTLSGDVDMIQAFDRIYIFRGGERTLEFIPGGRSIESAAYTSASGIVNIELKDHGLSVGDSVTTADIGFVTTDPNGTHTVSTVVDADNFQYVISTGGGDETYTANTGTATAAGFTLVPAGEFTQPQAFNIAGNAWSASGGVVSFTVAGNTTLREGDFITVDATDVTELQPLVGNRYELASATTTTVTFNAPIADFAGPGTSTEYIEFSGRFSQGGGFFHSPAPEWGVHFQRRLWVPYRYTPGGTGTSPTYTDRDVRDQIAASDILDPATFDSIASQFRVSPGVADYTVGLQPFYDDSLIVLNRNSLHLIVGTQGSLQDTQTRELTREIGCLARRSVVSQGNNVFFLSDNGVYGLSFVDEYNLRGSEKPLSEPIQPFIDRINKSLADKSVAVYFNNRYYIAVPLDSSAGADDAQGNNTVLIYNLLNRGWESIDTYGSNDFFIDNFVVAQDSKRNQLFLVNQAGGLHLADSNSDAFDTYSLNPVGDSSTEGVDYQLKSRGFGFGSLERKKFRRAQVQMISDVDFASDVDFLFSSEDPDTDEFTVIDLVGALGNQLAANEPGNIRFRLGNPRGIYGTLTINRKIVGSSAVGRPKVTSIFVEGYDTNRQTISQQ